jgi:predicted DsbA family dithiol-disulfide isomerase
LRKAVQRSGLSNVEIEWKPFMIDPGTAIDGEEFEAYNRRRWGGSGWTHHLRQEGAKDGAKFADWKWWPNTLRSHQWIQYGVEKHGLSTDHLNNVLFTALYERGMNLSLIDTLVQLGKAEFPGCDEQDLRAYLHENRGAAQVQDEINEGRRRYRIKGVPYFVVGDDQQPFAVFSGAQSTAYFSQVLEEVASSIED